jgi:PBP1b-binding outer membrane lipoprotein LpoB
MNLKKTKVKIFAFGMVFLVLLSGCVSLSDSALTSEQRSSVDIIGTVNTKFTTWQWLHIPGNNAIKAKAYSELKKNAAQQYGGNVEVQNIVITGTFSPIHLLTIGAGTALTIMGTYELADAAISEPGWHNMRDSGKTVEGQKAFGTGFLIGGITSLLIGNPQRITATGEVVKIDARIGAQTVAQDRILSSMTRITNQLLNSLPGKSVIAILNIASDDAKLSETTIDELELKLVDSRMFTIVDRNRLDQIRAEQNFQLSGDVSDDSAVSIGQVLGANIVLVGNITTAGVSGRITIRALDVKTGQIVTMARESF